MTDAQQSTASTLRRAKAASGVEDVEVGVVRDSNADANGIRPPTVSDDEPWVGWDRQGPDGLARAVTGLLELGRAESAVRLFAEAEAHGISAAWTTSDRVALALLHLGRPASARRIWQQAPDPPSEALRLTRLATASLAALDFAAAERAYLAALELDRTGSEAWFGLALLHTQRGDPAEALDAARNGLRQSCTPAQASFFRCIESLTDGLEK
jgi:tetratricopeptide (TPR) repeat protein